MRHRPPVNSEVDVGSSLVPPPPSGNLHLFFTLKSKIPIRLGNQVIRCHLRVCVRVCVRVRMCVKLDVINRFLA